VQHSPTWRDLIPPVRRSLFRGACGASARLAAVDVSSVASRTDGHQGATPETAIKPLSHHAGESTFKLSGRRSHRGGPATYRGVPAGPPPTRPGGDDAEVSAPMAENFHLHRIAAGLLNRQQPECAMCVRERWVRCARHGAARVLGDNYRCAPHCLAPFATERGAVASQELLPRELAGGLTRHGRLPARPVHRHPPTPLGKRSAFSTARRPRRRRGPGNIAPSYEKLLSLPVASLREATRRTSVVDAGHAWLRPKARVRSSRVTEAARRSISAALVSAWPLPLLNTAWSMRATVAKTALADRYCCLRWVLSPVYGRCMGFRSALLVNGCIWR
jgi:hypothetical protein